MIVRLREEERPRYVCVTRVNWWSKLWITGGLDLSWHIDVFRFPRYIPKPKKHDGTPMWSIITLSIILR